MKGDYYHMDALHWFNYLAFDVIGDLAFGAPFGMLREGRDFAEVRMTPDSPPTFAPAIEVLNRRGEVSGYVYVLCRFFTLPDVHSVLTIIGPSVVFPNSNPTPSIYPTLSLATVSRQLRILLVSLSLALTSGSQSQIQIA